jgi:threonine/homoserine/homoserine lactone efflux protein
MIVTALAAGCIAGFLGAIPPGPVGLAVLRGASERRLRDAIHVGLGGATVDTLICAAVGVGAGPTLARLASPAVRGTLSLAYAAIGAVVLVRELRRRPPAGSVPTLPRPPTPSYGQGLARGALNPTLFASWGLVIAFLLANGIIAPRPSSTLPFAAGAGIGVALWFALLAHLVASPRPRWTDSWVRRATVAGAVSVVVSGGVGLIRVLAAG